MSHKEKAVEPFSDLHVEHGHVRAVLLHDPTVEGLDMAIYMDGSKSMEQDYEYKKKWKSIFDWFIGKKPELLDNTVEPQVRWMLEYLATKDRNGLLRVAYWACGSGREVEVLGELKGTDVESYKFPGPSFPGNSTLLAPAIEDYIAYLRKQMLLGCKRGCAVFVTDGEIHDQDEVQRICNRIANEIRKGHLPKINFILVGVGQGVNEEQMEEICHTEYPGIGHLWCHRIAEEIDQVAELVAVLVDENMTVASGGEIYDDKKTLLKRYEGRLPAVLEFTISETAKSFTLVVNGQSFTQPIPEDDDDDDDDDHH